MSGWDQEQEREKVVSDIEQIVERYDARRLSADYWRELQQREARIRARLLDIEARIVGQTERRRARRPDGNA